MIKGETKGEFTKAKEQLKQMKDVDEDGATPFKVESIDAIKI